MPERDRAAVRRRCTRALSGETFTRRAPAAQLARLASAATSEMEADNYGDGEVVASFEREVAELLGMEAAVFLPSGTMAQGIALRIWSERRRCSTVAFHPRCHLELHEEHGYQHLHGLRSRLVGPPSGPLTVADLESIAEPLAALLLELPQRELGGLLPTWDELGSMTSWARSRGVALHLDGARLWESQPFYDRPLSAIAGLFDSVYVSVYKTLGGLAGCLLAGAADFIREARIWRRRLGGTLPALWPYALAGRLGLAERLPRIPLYVAKARTLAPQLAALPGIEALPERPPTNMFHLHLQGERDRLEAAFLEVAESSGVWLAGRLWGTDSPRRQGLEISCGEGALEIEDREVVALFSAVMEKGRGSPAS
jgi:threonine aldolase